MRVSQSQPKGESMVFRPILRGIGRHPLKPTSQPADVIPAMDLNALLRHAVDLGASDIHLKVGQPPILRRDGDLGPMEEWPALDDADLEVALNTVGARAPQRIQQFHESGDL